MPRWVHLPFVLALTLPPAAFAVTTFTGLVVEVVDGDTIEVLQRGKAVRIRLSGIDCPEKGQPYGKAAKQFTSEMTLGKPVTVEVRHLEKDGLLVADVILPDGSVLNQELLGAGLAWRYRKYGRTPVLAALEQAARKAKRGLWAAPNPVTPWCWRNRQKGLGC
jgi:endonuclease YncB( thermonuclease family)